MGTVDKRRETLRKNKEARNEKIKDRYEELSNEEHNGVPMFRHEYIINQIGIEFYMSPARVQDIVSGNDKRNKHEDEPKPQQYEINFDDEQE
jgi:hypothetical protein